MKITTTASAITLNAGATALAKMGNGFLARTTLGAWLFGSLGCCNLLFATAIEQAITLGVDTITYGVITFKIVSHSKNGYCSTATLTASALDCYGYEQTSTIKATLDRHAYGSATKCKIYKPAVKTENEARINYIDGIKITFKGAGFDLLP